MTSVFRQNVPLRVLLGDASKISNKAGDVDQDGYKATVDGEGYYFGWWHPCPLKSRGHGCSYVENSPHDMEENGQNQGPPDMSWTMAFDNPVNANSTQFIDIATDSRSPSKRKAKSDVHDDFYDISGNENSAKRHKSNRSDDSPVGQPEDNTYIK